MKSLLLPFSFFLFTCPSWAALSYSSLNHTCTNTGATTQVTATANPAANKWQVIAVGQIFIGGTPNEPTASGCNLTFLPASIVTQAFGSTNLRRATLLGAIGATPDANCAITIDYGGQSNGTRAYSWVEITDANPVSLAVQTKANTAGSGTNLTGNGGMNFTNAFTKSTNGTLVLQMHNVNEVSTQAANFTELSDDPCGGFGFQVQVATDNRQPASSWATSSVWGAVAFEVNQGAAIPTLSMYYKRLMSFILWRLCENCGF